MKIAFLEPLGVSEDFLRDKVCAVVPKDCQVVCYPDRNEDPAVLVERSKDAEIVVLSNIKFGKDIIEKLPNLKMICVAFTGVDHIDMAYCKERSIDVCNCAGYSTSAVADLVFGLVISLARNIHSCDNATRFSQTKDGLVGFELEGKTFGIIGTGAIGCRVANIANAFGCNVIAYSRTVKDLPGVTYMSLEDVLRKSDIVSLHVPVTDQTRGMIGKEQLAMMKPTAMLINTARGPVVDTQALADALALGTIAAAGIDVFDVEPPIPVDNPLLTLENTVLTPHVAFASAQAFEKRMVIVAEDIKMWLAGTPINLQ